MNNHNLVHIHISVKVSWYRCSWGWCVPASGACKLNTDGAYQASRHRMGMRGITRGRLGEWIGGFMEGIGGQGPLKTKVLTLLRGLKLLWDLNFCVIVCEIDCLVIVDTLKDKRFQFHELASNFRELWDLLHRDWSIQLEHVPRSTNEVADCLVGLGIYQQCAFTRLEVSPPLHPFLAKDVLAL